MSDKKNPKGFEDFAEFQKIKKIQDYKKHKKPSVPEGKISSYAENETRRLQKTYHLLHVQMNRYHKYNNTQQVEEILKNKISESKNYLLTKIDHPDSALHKNLAQIAKRFLSLY